MSVGQSATTLRAVGPVAKRIRLPDGNSLMHRRRYPVALMFGRNRILWTEALCRQASPTLVKRSEDDEGPAHRATIGLCHRFIGVLNSASVLKSRHSPVAGWTHDVRK